MNDFAPLPRPATPCKLPRRRRSSVSVTILSAAALAAALLAPVAAAAQPALAGTSPVEAPASTPVDESSFPVDRPGHARHLATGGRCQLSVAASAPRITVGETVTLTGRLSCAEVASAAGEPVAILQRLREGGSSVLNEVGNTTTAPDGTYQFTSSALEANSVFVVRSASAHGAHVAVKVTPAVTIEGPAPGATLFTRGNAGGHNRLTFTGTVSPGNEGARVALQREYAASGEQWRTIAFARVGPEDRYSITHAFRTPGQVSVRVVVRPTGANLAAASEALSYVVAQTQNPRLTIEASADPVSYGQSVTITGVAAGAPGQSVTLLERTPGHAFAAVGKDVTSAGGAYSFTVAPRHNAYYRAVTTTTTSTQLFEAFKYALNATLAPETVQDGARLIFSGTLLPAPAGQVVRLEQQNASAVGFHVIAEGTVDAESGYSLACTFNGVGSRILRIKVPANPESQGTTSEPFTIGVTPSSAGGPEPG
jgi:hypothetical protein